MENITSRAHTHPTYIPLHLNYEKMKVTLVYLFSATMYIWEERKTFLFLCWEEICYVHVNIHYLTETDNSASVCFLILFSWWPGEIIHYTFSFVDINYLQWSWHFYTLWMYLYVAMHGWWDIVPGGDAGYYWPLVQGVFSSHSSLRSLLSLLSADSDTIAQSSTSGSGSSLRANVEVKGDL